MSGSLLALLAIFAVVLIPVRMFGRWLQGKGRELERGRKDQPDVRARERERGPFG
jgi:hypothetical protein